MAYKTSWVSLLLLLGTSCASYVYKSDMSNYEKDQYECKKENSYLNHSGSANSQLDEDGYSSNASYGTNVEYNTSLYQDCMEARGYQYITKKEYKTLNTIPSQKTNSLTTAEASTSPKTAHTWHDQFAGVKYNSTIDRFFDYFGQPTYDELSVNSEYRTYGFENTYASYITVMEESGSIHDFTVTPDNKDLFLEAFGGKDLFSVLYGQSISDISKILGPAKPKRAGIGAYTVFQDAYYYDADIDGDGYELAQLTIGCLPQEPSSYEQKQAPDYVEEEGVRRGGCYYFSITWDYHY